MCKPSHNESVKTLLNNGVHFDRKKVVNNEKTVIA